MSFNEPDSTSKKKLYKELMESETNFRMVADFTYDWEYWISPEGRVIYCSPSSKRITGYEPQDFVNRPQLLHEIIHPDDQPLLGGHFLKIEKEDTSYLEYRIITRKGDVRWISHACKSVFDENNDYLGCRVSNRDVTDQKLAEKVLKKSEEQYRTLFETMIQGVIYRDSNGHVTSMNPAAEKILGYNLKDIINKKIKDPILRAIHEDGTDFPAETHPATVALKTGKTVKDVVIGIKKPWQEGYTWLNMQAIPLFRPGEETPYQVYTIFEDITSEKQTELALKEVKLSYESLFFNDLIGLAYCKVVEQSPEPLDFVFIDVNNTYESFSHLRREDVLGKKITQLMPDLDQSRIDIIANVGLTGESIKYEQYEPHFKRWFDMSVYSPKKGYFVIIFFDITDRKKAENALRETQEKLRFLFEMLPVGVSIIDQNRSVIDANPALEQILRLSREEIINGKHMGRKYIRPDGREMNEDEFPSSKILLSGDQINEAEIGISTKAGQTIWTNVKATALPFPDWRGLVLTSDITQNKESEKALKKSEKSYRELVDNSLVGIFKTNLHGDILFANDAMAKIYDYDSVEQLKKDNISTLYQNQENRNLILQKLKKDGHFSDCEVEMVDRNGKPIYVLVSVSLDHGVISGMFMDITRSKIAEQNLRKSEERYRSLFNQMIEGFAVHEIISDKEGVPVDYRFLDINPAFEKLTGLKREKVIGKLKSDVVPNDTVDWVKVYGKVALTGQPIHIEDYSETLKRYYDIKAYSPKPDHFATIFSDITERKVAEDNLKVTLKRLEKSNYDLEQFAYVASHDLQEPLRMISSFLQLLQRRYKDNLDKDANDFIGFAVDGASRMQELINDLLAFSRQNTRKIEFEKVNTQKVLDQVIFESKMMIEKNNAIITHGPLPIISADYSQMTQLLQNLIINAVKYHGPEKPKVHVTAQRDGKNWLFSVSDNGIGIDENQRDRIFKIFQRLHARDEYGGTGIGLAIAKRIVERHDGIIWVESEPGKGSTFYFTIPQEVNYAY
ncbi:MAG: PAS domain S-box protein [Methanobacteriaceae archaeon]|nr:PAS domain S-box protein [Methanobacteriaceae archaeon]